MRGNRSERVAARKSPRCHVTTPLLLPNQFQKRLNCLLLIGQKNIFWLISEEKQPDDSRVSLHEGTVAHICKHNKQFLKHNKHFSKHNIVLSEHNKLLSKHNTVLSKHIAILSKHNTVFLKHNIMSSKHNTIYRNTTQSLQNTTQISQNTTQYLRNTTQCFPDYVIQDATIQGINPGRYFIYDSYSVPIYIYSYLLPYLGPVQTSNFTCAELNSYFSRLK